MKKTSPGLYCVFDIGAAAIKAVVIEVNDAGKRLINTETEAFEQSGSFSSEEEYMEQVTEKLSELAQKLPLAKCKKIASTFYNRELQVKIIDMPDQVKPEQLEQVLPWEAKKLLSSHYKEQPFAFSYSIIKERPMSIALAVIPQQLLENHLAVFNNAGIKIDSVYTDVFSAMALQPIVDLAGLPALSIVNFGYSGTHVQIFSTGKLKFYRFIPSGTAEMGNPPRESDLEMYSQKIRFSFDYFRAVSKLSQVDNLYFMGGGCAYDEVLPFEQTYFNPTKVHGLDVSSAMDISPIMSANKDESVAAADKTKGLLPYIPAIGACLAAMNPESDTMDLKTQFNKQERTKNIEKLLQTLPYVLAALGIIISFSILTAMYSAKKAELDDVNLKLGMNQNEISACEIKMVSLGTTENEEQLLLSPQSKKVVEPIISHKYAYANLFIKIMACRQPGMKITDVLLRNNAEAEDIALKDENDNTFGENQEEDNKLAPYTSKFTTALSEQQIKEDFTGNIAIIHGIAETPEAVCVFSEALAKNAKPENMKKALPPVIKRYLSINTRKSGKRIEFLLKGELL